MRRYTYAANIFINPEGTIDIMSISLDSQSLFFASSLTFWVRFSSFFLISYDSLELHFIMEVHILTLSSFMYISLHMFDNSCNRYLQWKTGIFYDFISFFFSLGGKITGSSHFIFNKTMF